MNHSLKGDWSVGRVNDKPGRSSEVFFKNTVTYNRFTALGVTFSVDDAGTVVKRVSFRPILVRRFHEASQKDPHARNLDRNIENPFGH